MRTKGVSYMVAVCTQCVPIKPDIICKQNCSEEAIKDKQPIQQVQYQQHEKIDFIFKILEP